MSKILKAIRNPNLIMSKTMNYWPFKKLPDDKYLKLKFRLIMGKSLDFNNLKTFNEKLQWLKLYDRKDLYTQLVDKYEVREFISRKIGSKYLIPLIGIYDEFEDIPFEELPNQFVLKCTHDSGSVIICKDKIKFNIKKARKELNKSLKRNFYYIHREWPYKNVKPRIICEKYIVEESENELKDYKVHCFNGIPKMIQVDFDRFKDHKRNLYDTNWNYLRIEYKVPTDEKQSIKKPDSLEELLSLCRVLSSKIPYVRVDFYSIGDVLLFGELTFHPEAGFGKFNPRKIDKVLGDKIVTK